MSREQSRGGGRGGGGRKHPYGNRGNRHISSMVTGGQRQPVVEGRPAPPPPPPARVATPPLTEAIPSSSMRFADLGVHNLLHPVLLQTLTEDLKFDHMMPVQEATLKPLLEKRIDCLAQAKTGTGKTVAFLLPAIQSLINRKRAKQVDGISLLVISPTRELAMQIAKEASKILSRLPQYKVCFAIGGTNKDREQKQILAGCDILIATPGRLYDHLSSPAIVDSFRALDTLVLDEADRLLDMGFMNALKDIIKCLPNKAESERQGMLFSATIAPHVQKFAHLVLSKDYKFISTISATDVQTHERVPQLLTVVPNYADLATALVASVQSEFSIVGPAAFKAIIFAPTSALADFYGEVLSQVRGLPSVDVIHSRASQVKRTKITDQFRVAKSAILVATDVIARGMDFPNVTNVFQIGLPMDKECYIHRLGRTARAGAEGRSTFIITESEMFFPSYTLKQVQFESKPADLTNKETIQKIVSKYENKGKVYQAWIGYYKSHIKAMNWSADDLVANANKFAIEGLQTGEIPPIEKMTVGKMGLKSVKGLNVVPNREREGHARGGGAGRNARGGGAIRGR